MNKKEKKNLIHQTLTRREAFVIPQISTELVGLRVGRNPFEASPMVSPSTGTNVKDVITIPEYYIDHDPIKAYDPYREKSKISEDELIRKYGTRFPEFRGIEEREELKNYPNYKKEEKRTPKKREAFGMDFGIIQKKSSVAQKVTPEAPFSAVEQKTVPIVSFAPIEKKSEITFESGTEQEPNLEKVPSFVFKPSAVSPITQKKPVVEQEEPEFESTFTIPSRPVEDSVTTIIAKKGTTSPIQFERPRFVEKEITAHPKEEPITYIPPTFQEPISSVKPEPVIEVPKRVIKKVEYQLPPLSLFSKHSEEFDKNPIWLEEKKEILNQTLVDFNIEGEVEQYTYGPTVTRYEIKLSSGINVKKIVNLEATIKMSLSAKTIRIEAPIPGKPNVGIEVPNDKTRMVHFGDIVDCDEFKNSSKPLYVALGQDIDGVSRYTDITKMPHCLVAGATNSGKSVCINTILISLLLRNKPDDLKLILIDPKQVELIAYNGLPHLITPVISDAKIASQALKWVVDEMENRYRKFAANRVRDMQSYNEKLFDHPALEKMPYIVIIIDELADLMMVCSQDVEDSIQRITQKARAAGIHLIVATQRPTTDVVKGTIKANIPARIAFRVASYVDSATILDGQGAENLLGRGDMLLKEVDLPVRIQGAYISDEEIDAVTDFILEQGEAEYYFTHDSLVQAANNSGGTMGSSEPPELLYNVALMCIEKGNCSINAIQTRFNLGFNRAQRIVDILEEMGIVSERRGNSSREILVTERELEEIFANF